jgi:hypothetical protein
LKDKTGLFWEKLSEDQQNQILEIGRTKYIPIFEIRHRLMQTKDLAGTETEFIKRARSYGLIIKPRFGKGGDSVVGYSVGLKPKLGDDLKFHQGYSLDKELSLPKMREIWDQEDSQKIMEEWKKKDQYHSTFGKAKNLYVDETQLTQIRNDFNQLKQKFTDQNLENNPEQLEQLLHSMSRVFYAWSSEVETNRPGVLSNMAYQLRKLERKDNYLRQRELIDDRYISAGKLSKIGMSLAYGSQTSTAIIGLILILTQRAVNTKKARSRKTIAQNDLNYIVQTKLKTVGSLLENQTSTNRKISVNQKSSLDRRQRKPTIRLLK